MMRGTRLWIFLFAALPGLGIAPASGDAYIPRSDDQVLERLPVGQRDPDRLRIRALRAALKRRPGDAGLSFELARIYVRLGKSQADPRFFGYAEGLLKRWWNLREPPSEALLLRADILQNRHEFGPALEDLEKILARDPYRAEAWLAKASILIVKAEYEGAQRSCLHLIGLEDPLLAAACLARVASLTGHADKSYELLRGALSNAPSPPEPLRVHGLTVLATIAAQIGRRTDAEENFKKALALRAGDPYVLGLYADFLLDEDRAADVVALLSDHKRVDSLLLRLALAKRRLASPDLEPILSDLEARFAASRLRGENLHPGDEARFRLFLSNQPRAALDLAILNWETQREAKDIRILLEAALASNDPAAAGPALDLIAQSGLEHARIRRLAASLEALDRN